MPPSNPFDVESHIAGLRRYARALARDEARADDLVQDTLLRAIERAGTFRPDGSLRAWLFAILHNLFITAGRQRAAEERRDAAFAGLRSLAPEAEDQEQAVRLRELADRFHDLPEAQRTVLHLVAVEGLSYLEAAEAIAVPVGTVMSRLSRARAALRERLADPREARPALRIVRTDHD